MPRIQGHRAASTRPADAKTTTRKTSKVDAPPAKKVDAYVAPAAAHGASPKVGVEKAGLSFAGKTGADAVVDLANYIEAGGSPFAGESDSDRAKVFSTLSKMLEPGGGAPKTTRPALLQRSAAATALLSLAGTAKADLRDQALGAYAKALGGERTYGLRMSMLVNLDAAKLPLTGQAKAVADKVRAELLPGKPPYEEWFKGGKHTLNVKHYVMDDF